MNGMYMYIYNSSPIGTSWPFLDDCFRQLLTVQFRVDSFAIGKKLIVDNFLPIYSIDIQMTTNMFATNLGAMLSRCVCKILLDATKTYCTQMKIALQKSVAQWSGNDRNDILIINPKTYEMTNFVNFHFSLLFCNFDYKFVCPPNRQFFSNQTST